MVIVGTDYIFVDFRDADYGTLTGYSGYQDMVLRFTPGYEYVVSDYGDTIQLGDTYHVWDMQPKQSAVKIPVTVQNDFSGSEGGTVTVDGVPQTSPYRTLWTLGNHTVEVAAKVNPDWYFDQWSDGGARSHTVNATTSIFGITLTAYYELGKKSPLDQMTINSIPLSIVPNPCNPSAVIRYHLPRGVNLRLVIYNSLGEQIRLLEEGFFNAGEYETSFDGEGLPSGSYFCRLYTDAEIVTRRLLLLR
jgi:hypothetical protein